MLLIVPHLFPAPHLVDAAGGNLRLPGLRTLLARGRLADAPAEGAEAALCEALGVPRQGDWPIAALTLAAEGQPPGDAWWMRADPVHLRVMRDRIVLAGSGHLALTHAEAEALASSIRHHFGDALRPRVLHPHRWYLRFETGPDLRTTPLSVAIGRDIQPLMPQGRDSRSFRALLNELQMLLHDHPVNQAREARGALPVNSVWLWGGGHAPTRSRPLAILYAEEAAIRTLAAGCGAAVQPLPRNLDVRLLQSGDVFVLDALVESGQLGDAWAWREQMHALERAWFSPLRQHLRRAGRSGIQLLDPVHGKVLKLTAWDAWRIWRRRGSLPGSA